jgi:segregation and condensation protein B
MSKKAAKKSKHKESAAKSKGTHSKAADKSAKQSGRSVPELSEPAPADPAPADPAPSDSAAGANRRGGKTRERRGAAPVEDPASTRETKSAERKARKIIAVPSPKPEGAGGSEPNEDVVGFANSPFAAEPNEDLPDVTADVEDGAGQQVNERAERASKPAKASKQKAPKGKGTPKESNSNEGKATKAKAKVSHEAEGPEPVDDETTFANAQARGEAKPKTKSKPRGGAETAGDTNPAGESQGESQGEVGGDGKRGETKAKTSSKKASKKKGSSKEADSKGAQEDVRVGISETADVEDGVSEPLVEPSPKGKKNRSKQAKQAVDASDDPAALTTGAEQDNDAALGDDATLDDAGEELSDAPSRASSDASGTSHEGATVTDEDSDEEEDAVLSLGDSPSEADEEEEQLTEEEENQRYLKGIIEALLFASDKPLTGRELARAARIDKKRTLQLLAELRREYRHRGVNIVEVNGGFVLRSNPAYGAFVQKALALRPVKLSRAQLETLAIIAYRQPITRPEIDEIRGVDSGQVLKGLADRDLIKMVGKKDEAGRPMLYGTTDAFLELFNLDSLKGLPNLREFTELTEDSREKFAQATGETIPGPTEISDAEATATDGADGETVDGEALDGEALDGEALDGEASSNGASEGDEPSAAESFAETESAEVISEQTPVSGETELEEEALDVELDAALSDAALSDAALSDAALSDAALSDAVSDDAVSDDAVDHGSAADASSGAAGDAKDGPDAEEQDVEANASSAPGAPNVDDEAEERLVGDEADDGPVEGDIEGATLDTVRNADEDDLAAGDAYDETVPALEESTEDSDVTELSDDSDPDAPTDAFEKVGGEGADEVSEALSDGALSEDWADEDPLSDDELK